MSDKNLNLLTVLRKNNKSPESPDLEELFKSDQLRFNSFSSHWKKILFDYSRTGLNQKRLSELHELVTETDFEFCRKQLQEGEIVNLSERRSADHCLLRASHPENSAKAVGKEIQQQREAMVALGVSLSKGIMPGYEKEITDVIHIGIGGSVLGPQLVLEALQGYAVSSVRVHFISSADGWDVSRLTQELNPESTVVIAVSKSFSTQEMQLNLGGLQQWISESSRGTSPWQQIIAITSQQVRAEAAGFLPANILLFPESIGGRYSLWSAVGIPIVIRYGSEVYLDLLAGAEQMDTHFFNASITENLPVAAALVTIWHRNVCQYPAVAVVSYDSRLRLLASWLQQLDMESAGKSVDKNGNRLEHPASPVIFGGLGTDVQHAFFQALYQGLDIVPVDFIGVVNNDVADPEGQGYCRFQLANLIGQANALAFPVAAELAAKVDRTVDSHRQLSGSTPSTVILLDSLNPQNLGSLLAFYEHRIFVQSVIWGNNPFDQFGVEFGKQSAKQIEAYFKAPADVNSDEDRERSGSLEAWVKARL